MSPLLVPKLATFVSDFFIHLHNSLLLIILAYLKGIDGAGSMGLAH